MRITNHFISRSIITILALLAVVAAASGGVAGQDHGRFLRLREGTSSNWSGYAAYGSGNSFSTVSGSWTQPVLSCGLQNTYSSYWVGLDGYNSSTVEQLGTEGDCSNGRPTYYAWYEMYPYPGYYIRTVSVHTGDVFSASVRYTAGTYTLSLTNVTTGQSATVKQHFFFARRSSAEVVLEAPSSGTVLPLANFGTANFTASAANGAPLGSFTRLDPLTMLNPAGSKATPSLFDATKQNFSVTYSATQ